MKILVFSDAHNTESPIRAALDAHRDADTAVFLGDGAAGVLDLLDDYPRLSRCILKGNCDSRLALAARGADLAEELVLDFGGVRFLCLHGHTRGVKTGLDRLRYYASEVRADAVLFGHTHIPVCGYEPDPASPARKILLFNPGSVGMGYGHPYGVIHAENGTVTAEHRRDSAE